MLVFPTFKVVASANIISTLYIILVADGNLPKLFYAFVGFLMFEWAVGILLVLDMASKIVLLSGSIQTAVARWRLGRTSVIKKYVKAMQPIGVFSGPFHVVDRERGPALLRFCLHRTLLLVVQSRTWALINECICSKSTYNCTCSVLGKGVH